MGDHLSIAERNVQDITLGVRSLLLAAGLPACFWPFAIQAYCNAENMRPRRMRDGSYMSPYEKRHGSEFPGQNIPFGAGVYYSPPATRAKQAKGVDAGIAI